MGNEKKNWFAMLGTGYVLGKFAMTLISHGMAGELRDDGIACNTLWPAMRYGLQRLEVKTFGLHYATYPHQRTL